MNNAQLFLVLAFALSVVVVLVLVQQLVFLLHILLFLWCLLHQIPQQLLHR